MVFVKDKAARRAAYERAIPNVPGAYKAGIDATQGWKAAAIAGQQLYEEKILLYPAIFLLYVYILKKFSPFIIF